ncbi:hypothetical protein AC623_05340 [Bacillus sp. FJAT-27231]|uniref:hypothetical protein n=1 Tax=Bacillus sp. FJAT-27231 TaxID=1679168 RepID=UPI00067140B3|nr:hypothetical protein [Bacillus sp. FJAT-27231]KMY53479.1 hypothetical protein AC623_05340 [Bacillus sp. FJAT-27231]
MAKWRFSATQPDRFMTLRGKEAELDTKSGSDSMSTYRIEEPELAAGRCNETPKAKQTAQMWH